MLRPAEPLPVSRPVSPPMNRPPAPKKKYVATSPSVEGLRAVLMSEMASVGSLYQYVHELGD